MSNRKLIRPSLAELKDQVVTRPPRKKPSPHESTNAENFYYLKQIQNSTPMVLVLQDGEVIRGIIEWYDKNSVRVKRQSEPHVMVLKHFIKYMYKENEDKEKEND